MPDTTATPIGQQIAQWRARWTPERIEDVVKILQEDPQWGGLRIIELPWYTVINGFERWPDEEKGYKGELEGSPILDLRGCPFPKQTDLRGAFLVCSRFEGATLVAANLCRALLAHAEMCGIELMSANFSEANLFGTHFQDALLFGANFTGANLFASNLNGAKLWSAVFSGANLTGAQMSCAWLHHVRFINCQLSSLHLKSEKGSAVFDEQTDFIRTKPDGSYSSWLMDYPIAKDADSKSSRLMCHFQKSVNAFERMVYCIKPPSTMSKRSTGALARSGELSVDGKAA